MRIRMAGGLVTVALVLGGCSDGSPEPAAGSTATDDTASGRTAATAAAGTGTGRADAATALVRARAKLAGETYRYVSEGRNSGVTTGRVDPQGRNSESVLVSPEATITIRRIDGVNYMKVRLTEPNGKPGTDGKKWVKTPASHEYSKYDPAQISAGLDGAAEVNWVDDDTVGGIIDVLKISGADPGAAGQQQDTRFPFEADIDADGRLVTFRLIPTDGTPAPPGVTFSDFGAPVDLTAPTGADLLQPRIPSKSS